MWRTNMSFHVVSVILLNASAQMSVIPNDLWFFLLAGYTHCQLDWSEWAGAAVPLSGGKGASCRRDFLERHPRCGSGQWHPVLDSEAAWSQWPLVGGRSYPHPFPHAGLPHPGYSGWILGEPGVCSNGWSTGGEQSGLWAAVCRCEQSGAEGPARVSQLTHWSTEKVVPWPTKACHCVAPRKCHLSPHSRAGLQAATSDSGAWGCHLSRGTSLLRV